jgi:hypothetical protein
VILSQVIANYWKKVKQPSHSKVNQDYVILSSSPALSSSSYPLISPFEGLAQKNILKKRILMVIQVKIPFPEKFSSFVGSVLSMGLQPSYL